MADQRFRLSTLPVNLIIEDKTAIIIGNSADVYKKLIELKDTNLKIDLLLWGQDDEHCQKSKSKLQKLELESKNKVQLIETDSLENTLDPRKYIFCCIATNSQETNQEIIAIANANNLLSSSIGTHQCLSDFTYPLSFQNGDLDISLSTKGMVDRRARAMKSYLQKHAKEIEDVSFIVLGTDHNHLPLEIREGYHLHENKYDNAVEQLNLISGVQEFFLLNTCNRVELYAIVSNKPKVLNMIKKALDFDHMTPEQYYLRHEKDAFIHLGLVMTGLLAQIPGETHVVQQLKKAVEIAKEKNHMGGLLLQLFDNSLFISKQARQKTSHLTPSFEIEDLAVKYLHEELNFVTNKTIIILGSGVVGKGLTERVLAHGAKHVLLFYRSNIPDISAFSSDHVSVHQISEMPQLLKKADVIFSAVSTNRLILHSAHKEDLKDKTPVKVIDVCVPRSIDHILNNIPNIELIDMEGLKIWHQRILSDLDEIREIGKNEIKTRMHRYEKIFDKEWMPEQ